MSMKLQYILGITYLCIMLTHPCFEKDLRYLTNIHVKPLSILNPEKIQLYNNPRRISSSNCFLDKV